MFCPMLCWSPQQWSFAQMVSPRSSRTSWWQQLSHTARRLFAARPQNPCFLLMGHRVTFGVSDPLSPPSCKSITIIMYNPITCQLARSWSLKWWYEEANWLGSLRRLDGFMWASFSFLFCCQKRIILKYDLWGPKIGNVPGASCKLGAMFQD